MPSQRAVRSCTAWVLVLLLAPAVSWVGKLTCLTGTDPSVANDGAQIAALRYNIELRQNAGVASWPLQRL